MARKPVSIVSNYVVVYLDGDEIQAAHFKSDELENMHDFIRTLKEEQDITQNQVIVLQNVEKVFQIRTSIEMFEIKEPFKRHEDEDDD